MEAVKKTFPNGDPNFFKPSYTMNKDEDARAHEPYANNVWVYACCTAITTNIIQLPKALDDVRIEGEEQLLTEHPLLTLLEKPNPLMDGPTFWENVLLDLLLVTPTTKGGQCFILAESGAGRPVDLTKGEMPKELYPFSDDFVSPVLNKADNSLMGWKYKIPGSEKEILYKSSEIIRIFLVDPRDMLKGQAPVWSVRQGIKQDLKAQNLNENFFNNNASLGGALTTDAELETKTADEIRTRFEDAYSGQDNAGRVPLLHSGVKYEMYSQTHQDMQFLEQRKYTREEICAAYRVPKFMVSVYEDINFATAKIAERGFWQNTLIPLDDRILRAFNNQWVSFVEDGKYALVSDTSHVLALQPDLTERLAQAKDLFALQVPVAEINRRLELQLEIDDYAWLQTALIPFSLKPAEDAMEPEPEPEPEEPPPEEGEGDKPDVEATISKLAKSVTRRHKDEQFSDFYIKNILAPDEKKFKRMLTTFLQEQRNKILDAVDAWAGSSKAIEKAKTPDPDSFLPGIKGEKKRLQKAVKPEYQRIVEIEAEAVAAELGVFVQWNINSPSMRAMIKERLKQIANINTTTFKIARKHIATAIEASLAEGMGMKETARLIKKEVTKVYQGRINSETIARTEVSSVHSQTRNDIYKAEGIEYTRWITAGDEKVRSEENGAEFPHDILDGAVAPINEGFNNGETIMYPLDPNASGANTINCRCVVVASKGE